MGNSNRYWGAVRRWWPSALLAITILVAARILYGAYCGFTSGEFAFFDYGVYTNTAWNLGHGNGFTFLVDKSYLTTHLSFSLMLLGPLFHIWDHPFLLALAQWLMLIGGAILIWRAASRAGVAQARIAALLFLFVAHPFTQQVLLCSFHGVGFYYWLLPWFYYTLAYRRRWCWMPWILLLGLREDAFITLLPLLLYFAIRDRWRAGYVMAVLSLLYGISAIFILYPAINGISLFERRGTEIAGLDGLVKGSNALAARLRSLWWIFLPLVPLAGRRLYPVLIFMSAALLQTMFSSFAKQYSLSNHYPAPIMITMALGILEMWRLDVARDMTAGSVRASRWATYRPVALVGLTIVSHLCLGYFWGGGHRHWHAFSAVSPKGESLVRASQSLPRNGLLVVDDKAAAVTANRDQLTTWSDHQNDERPFDLLLLPFHKVRQPLEGGLPELVAKGDLGIDYNDGLFVTFVRGMDTPKNAAFLDMLKRHYIKVAVTLGRGGSDAYAPAAGVVRYWEGDGSRAPINLSYGWRMPLAAGDYVATLRYQAEVPKRRVRGHWGTVGVYASSGPHLIAERPIPQTDTQGGYRTVEIPFSVTTARSVEIHVTGADAQLWLDAFTVRSGTPSTL